MKWNQFKLYFNFMSVHFLILAIPRQQSQAGQPDTFNHRNPVILKQPQASCSCLRFNRGCIIKGPLREPILLVLIAGTMTSIVKVILLLLNQETNYNQIIKFIFCWRLALLARGRMISSGVHTRLSQVHCFGVFLILKLPEGSSDAQEDSWALVITRSGPAPLTEMKVGNMQTWQSGSCTPMESKGI